jgi:hypothetical protein
MPPAATIHLAFLRWHLQKKENRSAGILYLPEENPVRVKQDGAPSALKIRSLRSMGFGQSESSGRMKDTEKS